MNKADLVKLALQQQSGKTSSANQPSYLTKNGSIFNAPNANKTLKSQTTNTSDGIAKLNTTQNAKSYENIDKLKTASSTKSAISELKEDIENTNPLLRAPLQKKLDKLEEKHKEQLKNEFQESQANLKSIARGEGTIKKDGTSETKDSAKDNGSNVSAEEGKAKAKDAEKDQGQVKQLTAETKKDAAEVKNYQKDAKKTDQTLKKDQAKFDKDIAKSSKEITQNQLEMSKESQQMSQTRAEIDTLQAELQSLTAGDNTGVGERSAFSLKLAGEQDTAQVNGKPGSNTQASGSDDKNSRIAELQAQIGAKSDSMQVSGQKLQKLQTSTNKSITVMHNKVRLKSIYYGKAQKTMQAEQKTSEKIMKVADKIDNISQTVSQVGKTLQYVGKGMMIAGKAMTSNPFTAAAGAALITAGGFTQKAGNVTEMVGNYGSMAANVTKTACNVAEGNFAAALQTAGTAIQAGAAAEKTRTGLSDNMKAIDAQVENAQNELAAGTAANQAAKEMKASGQLEELNMTKGQAKAGIKEEMMGKIQNGEVDSKGLMKDVKNGNAIANGTTDQVAADFTKAREKGIDNMMGTGKKFNDKNMDKATKNAYKEHLAGKAEKRTKAAAGKVIKQGSSSYDQIAQVGKGLSEAGAKMGGTQKPQQAGRTGKKNYTYPQYTVDYNRLARGNNMMKKQDNVATFNKY